MQKQWITLPEIPNDSESLSKSLRIHPTLIQILLQRGIKTFEDAKDFFRPDLSRLHDPFLMKDMDLAVERIEKAIALGEKILIYGDYDVDGTTAVATVYLFFKELYSNIDYYIPNRYSEGYGISTNGIDYAHSTGCKLIIALDCGIKSTDKVEYAHTKDIDFIVCDHHLPGDEIPRAVAVLDPKRTDCHYPYKELSGCGIGFKLTQAYCLKTRLSLGKCYRFLDLVCVSIASDIVPITCENRILAFHGLNKLNSDDALPGLKSLKEISGIKKVMDISDIVFTIGPRINAAGRIDDAKHAVKLLTGETEDSWLHAETLHNFNSTRKDLDRQITAEALSKIEADEDRFSKKTTVVFHPEWNKGVIGIVASRLTEHYYRPTVVLTESDGKITGSARSVKGFNLYEAIYSCSEHLIQFGGHHFAAGLTMHSEKLEAFKVAFEQAVSERITSEQLVPEIEIDAVIDINDISDNFYNIVKQMAPFGPGNMKPVFMLQNLTDSGYSKVLKDAHLKLSLRRMDGQFIYGIGFGMINKFPIIQSGRFDIVFTLEENEWEGKKSIQLMLKDLRPTPRS